VTRHAEAAIIVIGTELLHEGRVDTNGPAIAAALAGEGFDPVIKITVGDDTEAISAAFRVAAGRAGLIVACGGLGPTFDDLTREAVAGAFSLGLKRSPEIRGAIMKMYGKRGLVAPESAFRMADLIEGAEALANRHGSAPGQMLHGPPTIALVPGVPVEMEAMLHEEILPRLRALGLARPPARRIFRITGLFESQAEQRVRPALERHPGIQPTILAAPGQVTLILRSHESGAAELASAADEVRALLGDAIFSEAEEGIETVVGRLLAAEGKSLATAESCTAGMLGAMITSVAGSSAWYRGGVICYADDLKGGLLGVPADVIGEKGAVSEETARAMAEGARVRLSSDFALSVTGVAGPGGGGPGKPVGLVWIALAGPDGTSACELRLGGARSVIRELSCRAALDLLRLRLGHAGGHAG
jgi:nicotinamide-nucleotide amidase